MKMTIFGLTVSSSWGNGHATLWRGLIHALVRRGWHVTFFERDVSYYAGARDYYRIEGGNLVFYSDWEDIKGIAERDIAPSDVAIVTSYCPDAIAAAELVQGARSAIRVFYDLDTPVTLSSLRRGETASYIGPDGLRGYDLVLSYTGGGALDELRERLGARRAVPLYGHVDPDQHKPAPPNPAFAGDLSYLGTYAADRQADLERLLVQPAWMRPQDRFVIGGAQYPHDFPWAPNIHFVRHLPPPDHPAFYGSSRVTLNVTRRAMAEMGWCPSGRLFEAAACGAAIATDVWPGLESFFDLGSEVLPVRSAGDIGAVLDMPEGDLAQVGRRARERVLAEHTSERRAAELEAILSQAHRSSDAAAPMTEVA